MTDSIELVEFVAELRKAIYETASERSHKLIEQDPEKYYTGECDFGYYDNGCGMACYGKEKRYDEDTAYSDAINEIADDIANESNDFEYAIKFFVENKELTKKLAKWIERQ